MPSANEIRQQFLDFFVKKHGHTFVPSSSVVPRDDPTLLFSNAGMNQFKDVFLGTGTRPYKRAANTQKCIRAGGKHNDLEDVGKDTYHHTFFEMLGNWSFGDYFKKEAIRWAWELLTKEWKLDKSRLHATVFEGDAEQGLAPDDEAAALWRSETDIDPSHIHKGNKKDNFWEMGETGPCGPCTEIHIDRTPDKSGGKLVNKGTPDVIEIWNLVFIQFNRGADKKLTPLPAKHVDTGMGFERVCAVLQGKTSNYDTDVFAPLMDEIGGLTGKKYSGKPDDPIDIAFRVIADHIRMLVFALSDGARFDNKGRGSVLRSVLRRAVRFGWESFGKRDPWIGNMVPRVVYEMRDAYPGLAGEPRRENDPGLIAIEILSEERAFLRTIERGLALFEEAGKRGKVEGSRIRGRDVFELHTTYGFPPDMTRQMARERGLTLDELGYSQLMREHEEKSRGQPIAQQIAMSVSGGLPQTDDRLKWSTTQATGKVLGYIHYATFETTNRLPQGAGGGTVAVGLILDQTCFYPEAGGQVGDRGTITTPSGVFEVIQTLKMGDAVAHFGQVIEGEIKPGETVQLQVDPEREFTRKNHTATHLLNWALRKVLGEHVEQRGSLVDPIKTRFDFTHDKPLSAEEIVTVEQLVNECIYADLPVTSVTMPLTEAKKLPGVRAVFAEKYPDPVRVLLIGPQRPEEATPEHSIEFCGGTHLNHTGQAGFFKIVAQELVGKGVRRVVAVTGREAVATVQRLAAVVDDLTGRFNCQPEDLPRRIEAMQEEVKKLQIQLRKGAASDLAGASDRLLAQAIEANGAKIIVGEMPAAPVEQMRQQLDRLREKAKSAVVVIGWADEGKVGLLSLVTDDLKDKGLHAGKLIGEVAKVVGGKGGGPPTGIAQAGGKDASKLGEALQLAKKLASEKLNGG